MKHVGVFRKNLADWFDREARVLPWREQPSLYKTVVSEFMLQQTQVKTVLPYFDRWLNRFPDFHSLASAEEPEVVKHWEGLGYYSRARNLHTLARQIDALDEIPTTAEDWLQFRGIGPYASAAITSIAFQHPAAVVDGNVIRILTRLTADATPFKDNNSALKALKPLADELLNPKSPGRHNEAMMELGATVCTKANPTCPTCPVSKLCQGRKNHPEQFPVLVKKQAVLETVDRAWALRDKKLLLHQIPQDSKRLAGMWELPLLNHLQLKPRATPWAVRRRGIGNSRITENIWKIPNKRTIPENPELHWIRLDELKTLTLSGPHKKWITELLSEKQETLF